MQTKTQWDTISLLLEWLLPKRKSSIGKEVVGVFSRSHFYDLWTTCSPGSSVHGTVHITEHRLPFRIGKDAAKKSLGTAGGKGTVQPRRTVRVLKK